jgi:hypothetical protein
LTFFVLLQDITVQTILGRIVAEKLSIKFNTEIRIKKLTVTSFLDIVLEGVEVNDKKNNKLIESERIQLKFEKAKLRKREIIISKLIIEGSSINLRIYKNDNKSNIYFLLSEAILKQDSIDAMDFFNHQKAQWRINCHAVKIVKSSFSFINENKATNEGVDFDHLELASFNLDIKNLYLKGDSMNFSVNKLSLKDKTSGFKIHSFEGDLIISKQLLSAKNLKINAMNSKLDLDFTFKYNSFKDFDDFERKIKINTNIRSTLLNLSDIGYFSPDLFVMEDIFKLSLKAQGTVSNFKSQDLIFDYGELTHFEGNVDMKGLPYILATDSKVQIKNLVTSANDINSFSITGKYRHINLSKEFVRLGKCKIIGRLSGKYNNFDAKVGIHTDEGKFSTEMNMRTNEKGDSTNYFGVLRSLNFNFGKIFGLEKYIGKLNLNASFNGQGINNVISILELKGVVDSLDFINNNYNKIKVDGLFAENKFIGHLKVHDENIDLAFNGLVDFGKQNSVYNFKANIENAQLYNLGLYKYNPTAVLSTNMDINFTGSNIDEYIGKIKIDSTHFVQDNKTYFLQRVLLDAKNLTGNMKRIELKSDYADAVVSGEFSFRDMVVSVNEHLALYMPAIFSDSTKIMDSAIAQNFEFKIDLKNTDDLTEIFIPDLKISENATVSGIYYSEKNKIQVEANAKKIIYKGIHFNEWYLKTNNDENVFMILAGSNDMIFKQPTKKDSVELGLENLNVLATIQHDSIDYRLRWDDYTKEDINKGYLAGYLKSFSPHKSNLRIYRSDFMVNNSNWEINPQNIIKFDSSRLEVENFVVSNNNQRFSLNGVISKNPTDSLNFVFENWELSNFDILINNPLIEVNGVLNGHLNLASLYQAPNVDASLQIENLIFNNEFLGKASIETIWDPYKKSLFSQLEIVSSANSLNRIFEAKGTYYPNAISQQLDFNLQLNNFSLHTLEPFTSSFISHINGSASGDFTIKGTIEKPIFKGDLTFNNASAKIDYLNVRYNIANKVLFKENAISFDEIVISDSLGNIATLGGKISHDYLSDFVFDFDFYPENIACLNTSASNNKIFYGQTNASGDVHIHGSANNLIMDIALETEKGTEMNIPLDYSLEVSNSDYIVFVDSKDTTEAEKIDYNVKLTGLSLNLNLSITEDAKINLFLPYNMGGLYIDGNSEMSLTINPRGEFEMFGDYVIKQGTFNLSMQNLLRRKFSIIEGGKISWNGNPYDALINVKALYKTKATPLPNIGIDNRKINVDCYLSLKDQLFDPEIDFSFKLPNVDKDVMEATYSVIDTTNDAVMNQQLIYLLILGAFNYDQLNQSNLGESSFRLLSNQLTNLLSQISKDIDIGVRYRPGDDLSREELEFALSTQLWDNRVSIDGNFEVIGGLQSSSKVASNIVGDVNIEVKLTKDGRFRIRAFNKSNVNASITDGITKSYDNISPYTQGVGIFYRKEFDRFGDIFKKQKKKVRKSRKRKKIRTKSDSKDEQTKNAEETENQSV